MDYCKSKYLGVLNIEENQDGFFEGRLQFKEQEIPIELELGAEEVGQDYIDRIDVFLDKFQSNVQQIKKELRSRLYQEGFVRDYISIVTEEFEEELSALLEDSDPNLQKEENCLAILYVCRIEFLLNEDRFAILDFTLAEEITNDLLVVGINESSEIVYTMIES